MLFKCVFILTVTVAVNAEIDLENPLTIEDGGSYIVWSMYESGGFFSHTSHAFYTNALDRTFNATGDLFKSDLNGEIWNLATDAHRNKIYYSDYADNFIGVYDMKLKTTSKVFEGMSFGIDSMAVDYVTGNVYWADSSYKWIMVSDNNFTYYRNIINLTNAGVPALVAVHPNFRHIYWVENAPGNCSIYRSEMGGEYPTLLYSFNDVKSIDAVTIDHVNDRLYWVDRTNASMNRVREVDIYDEDYDEHFPPPEPYTLYNNTESFFFSIASYKDLLYVTNFFQNEIISVNKITEEVKVMRKFSSSNRPRRISLYSKEEQPIKHGDSYIDCRTTNCEHFCVSTKFAHMYECMCRVGTNLLYDGLSCGSSIVVDNFALLMDKVHKKIYQLYMPKPDTLQEIAIDGVGNPASIDYDYRNNVFYWSDVQNKKVMRTAIHGLFQIEVMVDVDTPSLAIDSVSRNLYWVDATMNRIMMSSLHGEFQRTIHTHRDNGIQTYKFLSLVIDTKRGYVYWSSQSKVNLNYRIEGSHLDGSNRTIVHAGTNSVAAMSLAMDVKGNLLFWVAGNKIVWSNRNKDISGEYDIKTRQHHRSFGSFSDPSGLSYYQDNLYLTEYTAVNVLKIPVSIITSNTSLNQEDIFGPRLFYSLSGIKTFSKSEVHLEINVCSYHTCPQLCLPTPDVQSHQCVCQDGMVYNEEDNSCVNKTTEVVEVATTPAFYPPPSFENTCPDSRFIIMNECGDTELVSFTVPTAVDYKGDKINTVLLGPLQNPPLQLGKGTHTFLYSATDGLGQRSICVFSIQIIVRMCGSIPNDGTTAVAGKPTCGNVYGSIVDMTCPGETEPSYQYFCGSNELWSAVGSSTCQGAASSETSTLIQPPPTTFTQHKPSTTTPPTSHHHHGDTFYIDDSPRSTPASSTPVVAIVIPILLVLVIIAAIILVFKIRGTPWARSKFSIGWKRQRNDIEPLFEDGSSIVIRDNQ